MINKVVTFSYDDAVTQDIRLISILDKYGLKSTFNLNSELLGNSNSLVCFGKTVSHNKVKPDEVRDIYKNHEIAVHTLTHPTLTGVSDEEIIRQTELDRQKLSQLAGYEVTGMAYPGGGVNNDDRVAGIVRDKTGVRYARTTVSTYSFSLPENLYRLNPTIHHIKEPEKLKTLADSFIALKGDEPAMFYIWGHSYEFDADDSWGFFEEFCKTIAGRDDVLYLTNTEALAHFGLL